MKRILHCIESLDPSFGGPVSACANLTAHLDASGLRNDIVTLDAPGAAPHIPNAHIHFAGPPAGFYRYCRGLRTWLDSHVRQYDAVLLHGLWRHHSVATRSACATAAVPFYVFTHSMLNPWFNRDLLKRIRKTLYWRLAERRTLRDARAVIFGSEEEASLARNDFAPIPGNKVICPLGIADPGTSLDPAPFRASFPETAGYRLWLFLGRLHPVKGCDLLIDAFARVSPTCADVRLVMAGPNSGSFRRALERQASISGVADRIIWTGELGPREKWSALAAAELFVLPSHCESLSFSLVEALASGLPSVITDKVNTHAAVARHGGVIVTHNTAAALQSGLERWLALPEDQRRTMRRRARQSFLQEFDITQCTRRLLDLFRADLGWQI
jgi:glycosyltransferase involved in cell wall biosynthesis